MFKNHFIAGLCSVDKDFPLHLWDCLVEQAVITLNLLRGSRLNPRLSAWAQFHGPLDFNCTPIAPPGIRVIAHDKPADRDTWSPHGSDGWYNGPTLESYRCFTVWIWDTRQTRITNTLSWFPSKVTMPLASSTDLILAGIQDIIRALTHPSANSPLAPRTDSEVQALQDLTTLLSNIAAPPKAAPSLRVEPTDSIVLPVETPPCAPALRVEPTNAIVLPIKAAPSAPPLRVDPPPGFAPIPVPPQPQPLNLFPRQHQPLNPHLLLPMTIAQAPVEDNDANRPGSPRKPKPLHTRQPIPMARDKTNKSKNILPPLPPPPQSTQIPATTQGIIKN
jgi:hypothetical protein